MRITVLPDAEQATDLAAQRIADVIAEGAPAHIALAGGNTPRATYARLAATVPDWSGVELWLGDERMVPLHSHDSNYRMARETLVDLIGDGAPELHPVLTELPAEEAAAAYGELFALRAGLFSVALLGLGEDGHTASLFPGFPQLAERDVTCVAVHNSPKPPPDRISFTLPVFAAAGETIVLATGEGKADAVAAMINEPNEQTPASLLGRERLELILDRASAVLVPADRRS